jgi:hypothetical protein
MELLCMLLGRCSARGLPVQQNLSGLMPFVGVRRPRPIAGRPLVIPLLHSAQRLVQENAMNSIWESLSRSL